MAKRLVVEPAIFAAPVVDIASQLRWGPMGPYFLPSTGSSWAEAGGVRATELVHADDLPAHMAAGLEAVMHPRRVAGRRHPRPSVGISVGATLDQADDTAGALLERADDLMYQAKHSGKGDCLVTDQRGTMFDR